MRIGRLVTMVALVAAPVAVGQPPRQGVVVPNPPPAPWVPPPPPPVVVQPPPSSFPWAALLPSWIGAIVAVAHARKQILAREEEEEVTPTDGPEFEYKIIRNPFGAFKKPDKFRAALDEEARFGWQLVEKFDDTRVRLRRPVSCRQHDAEIGDDPYRIRIGSSDGAVVGWIILAVFLGLAAVIGVLVLVLGGR